MITVIPHICVVILVIYAFVQVAILFRGKEITRSGAYLLGAILAFVTSTIIILRFRFSNLKNMQVNNNLSDNMIDRIDFALTNLYGNNLLFFGYIIIFLSALLLLLTQKYRR